MENVEETIGIDVSKKTLDVHLHQKQHHKQFSNDETGYKKILQWIKSHKVAITSAVICFEHKAPAGEYYIIP